MQPGRWRQRSRPGTVTQGGPRILLCRRAPLRDSPRPWRGAARACMMRDALPQAVDVGTAELVGAAEVSLDGGPVSMELEENGAATGGVNEGAAGGGLEPSAEACDGECQTALDGVEVRSFGEGELELVAERGAGNQVEQGGRVGLLARLLQLEALISRHVGVGV
jgi:hypothetical protein